MPFGFITPRTERLECRRSRPTAMRQAPFGSGSLAASDLKKVSLSSASKAYLARSDEYPVVRTMLSKRNERRPRC